MQLLVAVGLALVTSAVVMFLATFFLTRKTRNVPSDWNDENPTVNTFGYNSATPDNKDLVATMSDIANKGTSKGIYGALNATFTPPGETAYSPKTLNLILAVFVACNTLFFTGLYYTLL